MVPQREVAGEIMIPRTWPRACSNIQELLADVIGPEQVYEKKKVLSQRGILNDSLRMMVSKAEELIESHSDTDSSESAMGSEQFDFSIRSEPR